MYGWPFWIVFIVGFAAGALFGLIVGMVIADTYWRKNLIEKQHYDKQYFAEYEMEKETQRHEHDNANRRYPDWW